MNHLTIIGNLTKDPELRSTKDGTNVCSFTVAVNRPKAKNNQNPETDYFNVTAWRQLGDNCKKFLEKGKKVAVVGRVSVRQYETQDGRHGASLEVQADSVEFITPRASDAETPATPEPPKDAATGFEQVETDDLPF